MHTNSTDTDLFNTDTHHMVDNDLLIVDDMPAFSNNKHMIFTHRIHNESLSLAHAVEDRALQNYFSVLAATGDRLKAEQAYRDAFHNVKLFADGDL